MNKNERTVNAPKLGGGLVPLTNHIIFQSLDVVYCGSETQLQVAEYIHRLAHYIALGIKSCYPREQRVALGVTLGSRGWPLKILQTMPSALIIAHLRLARTDQGRFYFLMSENLATYHHTRRIEPMLSVCWPTVCDADTTLSHHCNNISCYRPSF